GGPAGRGHVRRRAGGRGGGGRRLRPPPPPNAHARCGVAVGPCSLPSRTRTRT
ncbi:hypothetical protein CFC21_023554, partial [Triticum aestivum]